MNNHHYDPFYMGVDPNIYGTASMMTPVMSYAQPTMSIGSNQIIPLPVISPSVLTYDRYGSTQAYGFPESSHHTSGSTSTRDYEEEVDGARPFAGPSHHAGKATRSSNSSDGDKGDSHDEKTDDGNAGDDSPKKKPRVTLARGGACVNCRNRKLKCTGERPCKTCKKSGIDCRYEELTRRRPRAVLMEERVVELEQLLAKSGIPVPPSPLHPPGTSTSQHSLLTPQYSPSTESFAPRPTSSHSSSQTSSFAIPSAARSDSMGVATNQSAISIPPNSPLELGLINVVLPYTPYISIPVNAPRFLALLALPAGHPSRPHPALLYVLFAEAVRIVEGNVPLPMSRALPPGMFGLTQTPVVAVSPVDRTLLYNQVHGTSLSLIERAQKELNNGIRNVDRPFDLVRAALGISRYLYTLGRFIEGWNIPVARLAITCGLHRLTSATVSPDPSTATLYRTPRQEGLPLPYSSTGYYTQHHQMLSPTQASQPMLRKAPVIMPPARDGIDVAERSATWWAVKAMDWSASIGWGWVGALHDADCTTALPKGWNMPVDEISKPNIEEYSITDLLNPSSAMHVQRLPESTYTLSIMSLYLLQRASALFDRPSKRYAAFSQPSDFVNECTMLETATANLRKRIPSAFQHPPPPINPHDLAPFTYDGFADPWWIQLHVNLYTAEMLLYSEFAPYRPGVYDQAINSARAVVPLVRQLRTEHWAHIEMVTAICLSLVARFLNKESARLIAADKPHPAGYAAEDAEVLRIILERDIAHWLPMAGLHAMIVRRVKEGWPEKEGEYERI